MNRFPLMLHFILTCIAIGFAMGAHKAGWNPVAVSVGWSAAVGLGMTCMVRLFLS